MPFPGEKLLNVNTAKIRNGSILSRNPVIESEGIMKVGVILSINRSRDAKETS